MCQSMECLHRTVSTQTIIFLKIFVNLHSIDRYGLPFVSPNNILVSTINGAGSVIESIYVLIFLIYAPKNVKAKILGLLMVVLTIFSVIALVSVCAIHGNTRKLVCGLATTIFAILMYASPLSIMVRMDVIS